MDSQTPALAQGPSSKYVRHPRPFAGGKEPGKPLIYTCRRVDMKEEDQEFPLALKSIPRDSLSYINMEEIRKTQPQETAQEFDEDMMEFDKNLLREVKALRDLEHPNILRFVDSYWTADHANIVMEFAPGGDLQMRMERRQDEHKIKHYEEKELAPIMRKVCTTLSFVHAAGWAHRDLKPSKIMFRNNQNSDVVIAGFGFAIFQETIDGSKSLFMTTDVGTPEFKAPEQLQDNGHGIPVDMWALGVTCFYLLTGEYPFGKDGLSHSDDPSVINGLQWDSPGLNHLSDDAKDFIIRLLVWDPDLRMTSLEAGQHGWIAIEQ